MTLTIKEIWERSVVETDETGTYPIARHRFLAQVEGEALTADKTITLKNVTQLEVADEISKLLGNIPITSNSSGSQILIGEIDNHAALVFVTSGIRSRNTPVAADYDNDDEPISFGFKVRSMRVEVTGHRKAIQTIFKHLDAKFTEAKVSKVRWWFKGEHGVQNREVFLEPITTTLHQEFYPSLDDHPKTYLQKYLNSPASILLMHGSSGTGKTTLLRHLICDFNLTADVIYDEHIMDNDSVFQNFLFDPKSSVMIIEDADKVLSPRESHQNGLMSRFLNVSDGIIKLPDKKLIFTTNITDFGRVDPALVRSGRCFDVLYTRELTFEEACLAAKVAGVEIPQSRKHYTLAQIFNQETNAEVRKIGF
jgi:hypothetical protein